jgi:broad specificity phosphatase PhoE
MARLILIRHGESVANLERRFTRNDDEPLTAAGLEQARETGLRLAGRYRPGVVYSSPLLRARQTATLIAEAFGLEPRLLPGLHEQSFGELRGLPYSRYLELAPLEVGPGLWRRTPPGGESLLEVLERVRPIVDEIALRHQAEEAVVVSHGGVMAAIRGLVAGVAVVPRTTRNASGYRLEGRPREYRGPFSLFDDGPEPSHF